MLERGTKAVTPEVAERLAKIYAVTPSEVLTASPTAQGGQEQVVVAEDEPGEATEHAASVEATWFVGEDAFSERRNEIRDFATNRGNDPHQAALIAIALEPWLRETPATYEYFEQLRALRDTLPSLAAWTTAEDHEVHAIEVLSAYSDLAEAHGASAYAGALAAAAKDRDPQSASAPSVGAAVSPPRLEERETADRPPTTQPANEAGISSTMLTEAAGSPVLQRVRDAIQRRQALRLVVDGGRPRTFEPYVLGFTDDGAQVAGYDRARGAVRRFDLTTSFEIEVLESDRFDADASRHDRALQYLQGAREIIGAGRRSHAETSPPTPGSDGAAERLPQAESVPTEALQSSPRDTTKKQAAPSAGFDGQALADPERIFHQLEQVPQRRPGGSPSTASTRKGPAPSLPVTLLLQIGAHDLLLDRELLPRGEIGYILADPDSGRPARGGVRLRERQPLPDTITLDGKRHQLERVVLGSASEVSSEERAWRNNASRAVSERLDLFGRSFDMYVRVARRSDAEWSVMARLAPTQTSEHAAPRHTAGGERVAQAAQDGGDEEDVKLESIGGAPAIATPLFRLEGVWHCRWAIGRHGSRGMVPRELLDLNELSTDAVPPLTTADGFEIHLEQGKYGSYRVTPFDDFVRTVGAKNGDYLFVGLDARGSVELHRITKQRLGKASSHLRMASLLCGLQEEHATLASVLWALGAETEGEDLDTAIAIAEQRADGPLARELRAHRNEAAPPPDLATTFSQL
jgi:hypothetical protein